MERRRPSPRSRAGALKFEWGQPVDPAALRRELATGAYDTVTLIHNETSTGTMSDLTAIAAVLREFPEVISIVDTVSSFSVLPIDKDALGIDVIITGSQKALAMPPGLALITVSKRASNAPPNLRIEATTLISLSFKRTMSRA
jgi:aspartate aminotransferase-like enzyme